MSLTVLGNDLPLWSIGLPPLAPITPKIPFAILPVGVVAVQSTLALEGAECAASDAVDTSPYPSLPPETFR